MKKKLILIGLGLLLLVGMGATGRALYYKSNDAFMQGNDIGIAVLAVRNDTLAALTDTDGDYAPFQVNASGAVYVADETLATAVGTTNTSIGVTTSAKADVDGNGAVNAHLRRIGFEADRAGDFLSTMDADTGNIKTAIEGTEDELDGTTETGPLAQIAHTYDTLTFVRIDSDITGGSYATLVAASGSNKIYVTEIFLTVSAQCELEFVEDPAGTPAILTTAPPMYFAQRGGAFLEAPGYRFATNTVNKALGLDEVANGTVNVRGYLWYYYAP